MKECYENAEMDILNLEAVDVISTSDDPGTLPQVNPNCENEGPAGDAFL